ncbi:MAG TPA: acetamidase/formamidase family protein [Chitinophagaceae bacterium]|nr:acetamidase/formamidase family protein [Chitinophagaceae bacterium]
MKKYLAIALVILAYHAQAQKHAAITFKPVKFFSEFSSVNAPVLTIHPGDTVYTWTVDCDGYDSLGHKLTEGDAVNPLTGPFYIEGAEPGDILKVNLLKLSFSRNTAFSAAFFHPRSLPASDYAPFSKVTPVTWDLDIKKMTATPRMNSAHLKNFTIKIHPFLGCVGVAPAGDPFPTTDSGPFGGNMDFTAVTAGASIYLPVFHEGALLTIGDGHAAQGDGELNWDAVETSLNAMFTVQLIKKPDAVLENPRLENNEYLMAVGADSSLDVALKIATKGLLQWIQQEYHITDAEATQVLGSSLEYKIAEIVDPKVEVVAMIKKSQLRKIEK